MAVPPRDVRVLVIDDDEVVLVAIADLLEDAGFKVFTQASPIGATSVITRESIDLVVIDINMPVMKGDTVIRLFRTWDKMRDLPIVVISGADAQTLAEIQRAMPDVAVVRKLHMTVELVPVVQEALIDRGTERARSERPTTGAELVASFASEVARLMPRVRNVAKQVSDDEERQALVRVLDKSRDRAHLLGLIPVARVLELVSNSVSAARVGQPLATAHRDALMVASDALEKLPRTEVGSLAEVYGTMVLRIERTLAKR